MSAEHGDAYRGVNVDRVTISADVSVIDICDSVYTRNAHLLERLVPSQLKIYDTKSSFNKRNVDGQRNESLHPTGPIGSFGDTYENPIIVVVPSNDFANDTVATPEFIDRFNYTCRWEDDFFEIPHNIAHAVFRINDRIVLHRRRAVDELYFDLNDCNQALVLGPPGCGKSTSMFAMALSRASEYEGEAIMWIDVDSKRLLIMTNSAIDRFSIEFISSWGKLMNELLKDKKYRLREIYVDQCRLNHPKASGDAELLRKLVYDWVCRDQSRRLFAITSDGCNDLKRSGFESKDVRPQHRRVCRVNQRYLKFYRYHFRSVATLVLNCLLMR